MMVLHRKILVLVLVGIVLMQGVAHAAETAQAWEERFRNEPYVRLLKEVVVKINKDYSYTETTHIIDKVQNDAGKHVGEIEVNYEKNRQDVTEIVAHTILPDGTKMPYEKLQDLNAGGNNGVYSDDRVKILTMPNVIIGSIIDWKSVVVTKKPVIAGHFYDSFRITCTCPIKESRFRITAPKGMNLKIKNLNTNLEPRIETSGDEVTYTWEVFLNEKDEFEEYMPPDEETAQRITVSTLSNWKVLSDWAWSLYKKNEILTPEIKNKVSALVAGKDSVRDRIKAIIDYIQNDFRYISMNMESHSYEPHPAAEIFANKYGDCKDQTLLTIAMLSEAGVTAWPTLVSTGSGFGRTDLLPMPSYFNHVIIALDLDGKRRYIDVLVRGYGLDDMPGYLSAKRTFLINGQGGIIAQLPVADKEETVSYISEKVIVKDDGNALMDAEVTFPRGLSVSMREGLKTMGADEREKIISSLEAAFANGGKIISREWKNMETPYSRITLSMQFEQPGWAQKMGDMMIFGKHQTQRGKLFVSPKRRHPIVFSSLSGSESSFTYIIPDGYEIINLPKKILSEATFATFIRDYELQGNRISGREISLYKRARIPVEDYKLVQNFLDDLPRVTNDKIMIRKQEAAGRP